MGPHAPAGVSDDGDAAGGGIFGGGDYLDGLAAKLAAEVLSRETVDSLAVLVEHTDGDGAALRLRGRSLSLKGQARQGDHKSNGDPETHVDKASAKGGRRQAPGLHKPVSLCLCLP